MKISPQKLKRLINETINESYNFNRKITFEEATILLQILNFEKKLNFKPRNDQEKFLAVMLDHQKEKQSPILNFLDSSSNVHVLWMNPHILEKEIGKENAEKISKLIIDFTITILQIFTRTQQTILVYHPELNRWINDTMNFANGQVNEADAGVLLLRRLQIISDPHISDYLRRLTIPYGYFLEAIGRYDRLVYTREIIDFMVYRFHHESIVAHAMDAHNLHTDNFYYNRFEPTNFKRDVKLYNDFEIEILKRCAILKFQKLWNESV